MANQQQPREQQPQQPQQPQPTTPDGEREQQDNAPESGAEATNEPTSAPE